MESKLCSICPGTPNMCRTPYIPGTLPAWAHLSLAGLRSLWSSPSQLMPFQTLYLISLASPQVAALSALACFVVHPLSFSLPLFLPLPLSVPMPHVCPVGRTGQGGRHFCFVSNQLPKTAPGLDAAGICPEPLWSWNPSPKEPIVIPHSLTHSSDISG